MYLLETPRMNRSLSLPTTRTEAALEERQEILSPKSVGIQLVQCCCRHDMSAHIKRFMIEDFLERSPDLSVCDAQGSALMWVSFFGDLTSVKALIDHNAPLEVTSDLGYTPLHAAAQAGHSEVVDFLIDKGSIVSAQAQCGYRPLHLAAQEGHHDVVSRLLQAGALLEVQDIFGRTPLHIASWKGHLPVVQALLRAGANRHARAHENITPLQAAELSKDDEVIKALSDE